MKPYGEVTHYEVQDVSDQPWAPKVLFLTIAGKAQAFKVDKVIRKHGTVKAVRGEGLAAETVVEFAPTTDYQLVDATYLQVLTRAELDAATLAAAPLVGQADMATKLAYERGQYAAAEEAMRPGQGRPGRASGQGPTSGTNWDDELKGLLGEEN